MPTSVPPKRLLITRDIQGFTHWDKLVEMCHLRRFTAAGLPVRRRAETASGNYLGDLLLANICKQNVTRFPYEIARLAQDIAGGLFVTMPSEKDYEHPVIGSLVKKYTASRADVPVEHRQRMLRLIENLTLGTAAVGYLTESMHGAGSPQAQRIMITRLINLEHRKELAETLCGIRENPDIDW